MIFEQEIKDGLETALATSNNTIAYCSPISIIEGTDFVDTPSLKNLVESSEATNLDQMDLYYLSSILVSTGWNKNDDVFTNDEIWDARNTPEDKQLNFMHDESDIIGHITSSKVVDRSGAIVVSNPPDQFDIVTNGVIYTSWSNPETMARIETLIAEIKEGKWHVSMECLFAGFDYAIITPEGEHKVLARSDESAFLTKHLRKYGGKGFYEGFKIGRALKNVIFSGKGLVSNPANPRSIILNETQAFHASTAGELFTVNDLGESNMAEGLEKQVAELTLKLAEASEKNEVIRKEVEDAKAKEFEVQVSTLTETIATLTKDIGTKDASIEEATTKYAELEATLAAKEEELIAAKKDVFEYEEKDKKQKRKDKMVDAGFDADSAESTVNSLSALDDKAFDSVLATMATKIPADAAEEVSKSEAEDSDDDDDGADAGVLDELEVADAGVVIPEGDSDEQESTQASMATWLTENFLSK